MLENNYRSENSLMDHLKREEGYLKELLTFFDSQELADKFPDKTERLNKAMHQKIGPRLILRRAMKYRLDFIDSSLNVCLETTPEKAGINKELLCHVSEILNHN